MFPFPIHVMEGFLKVRAPISLAHGKYKFIANKRFVSAYCQLGDVLIPHYVYNLAREFKILL